VPIFDSKGKTCRHIYLITSADEEGYYYLSKYTGSHIANLPPKVTSPSSSSHVLVVRRYTNKNMPSSYIKVTNKSYS